MSHRLRTAMLRAQLDPAGLAATVDVDVETVARWLSGRLPHQCTCLAVAAALGETEADLWPRTRPDLTPGAEAAAEVVGAYAHRADIPHELWSTLLINATDRIDLLGYAYPFVLEVLPDAATRLVDTAAAGARMRMAFADPDCPHVAERDNLEQMGGTLPGRIRNALNYLDPIHGTPGVEIGLHTVHLYHSVFRFDQQMIVAPVPVPRPRLPPRPAPARTLPARDLRLLRRPVRTDLANRHPVCAAGATMTGRRDYYHDPVAPPANSLVPGVSAIVTDDHGRILMQRRTDSGNWALPGGTMDIGETLQHCAIREVKKKPASTSRSPDSSASTPIPPT